MPIERGLISCRSDIQRMRAPVLTVAQAAAARRAAADAREHERAAAEERKAHLMQAPTPL